MDIDFWHERWQANLTGFHQSEANNYLVRYWPQLNLPKDSRILVPLCGKSLDMLWLCEQGHKVVGIEVSQIAIETFFEENGLTPAIHEESFGHRYAVDQLELLCADFFSLTQEEIGAVSAFYDRAALIALTPAQRAAYASHLTRLIGDGTTGLLITLEYNQLQMSGPPFSVRREEVGRLFESNYTIEQLFQFDALEDNEKFREKGLTELTEHAYHLQGKQAPVKP